MFPKLKILLLVLLISLMRISNIKKTAHPYVPLQAQIAPTIEPETQAIDNEIAKLKEQGRKHSC